MISDVIFTIVTGLCIISGAAFIYLIFELKSRKSQYGFFEKGSVFLLKKDKYCRVFRVFDGNTRADVEIYCPKTNNVEYKSVTFNKFQNKIKEELPSDLWKTIKN